MPDSENSHLSNDQLSDCPNYLLFKTGDVLSYHPRRGSKELGCLRMGEWLSGYHNNFTALN